MTGFTFVEKALARAAGVASARAGDVLDIRPDLRTPASSRPAGQVHSAPQTSQQPTPARATLQGEPANRPGPSARKSPPSLLIRGWNFATALARWTTAGMPRRTEAEIAERLAICQSCPHLQADHCNLCGCACVETNRLINKLALATERCPVGKW